MTIWMDLTNSLTAYEGSVVGIIRAELMLAKMLHEIDKDIRFSVLTDYGFAEVPQQKLNWLWESENLSEAYLKYQNSKKNIIKKIKKELDRFKNKNLYKIKRHAYKKKYGNALNFIIHPYKENDTIYSCGWLGSKKEEFFYKLKTNLPDIKFAYTIYDAVILKDNIKHFYSALYWDFENYLWWINKNCDLIIYGGECAKNDTESFFLNKNCTFPPSCAIKWGDEINKPNSDHSGISFKQVAEKYNIDNSYIFAIGTIDYKKNYRTLYQAYCQLILKNSKNIPQLIITGKKINNILSELIDCITSNPLVKDKIRIINCSDEELDLLYKNCLFTVLPTLYEGWSLTLPESFRYGKLCLCSDVAPLREVGKDLPVYINPYHPKEWAEKIEYYMNNPNEIKACEEKIKANWKPISWLDSANILYKELNKIEAKSKKNNIKESNNTLIEKEDYSKINIFYDMGLLFIPALSGIPRAQLLIARQLYKCRKDIEFFRFLNGEYYRIPKNQITNILGEEKIDIARRKDYSNRIELQEVEIPFKKNSLVFSAGVGYDEVSFKKLYDSKKKIGFIYSNLIYDFTPLIVPQTHSEINVKNYTKFLPLVYKLSDVILYGGKTAQKDGINYQKENNIDILPGYPIKFGSDIVSEPLTKARKHRVFRKHGIQDDFIMTVGTLEARKNHELLYEAYLELLRTAKEDEILPQLVICGNNGWKTEEFQNILRNDTRIKDKIIWITPNDDELDTLYQACKFTLLASFYEGWSLTLPESLNYGKFCLASDTPSLKEIGEEIIDYANPYDPVEWAEKIRFYYNNPDVLAEKENLIKEKWNNTTWKQCAQNISNIFDEILTKNKEK